MEVALIPQFILRKLSHDADRRTHLNILISTLLILLLANFIRHIPHFCLFEMVLKIPCPGCGIMTSIRRILVMDFTGSLHANPIGVLIVLFYGLQIPLQIYAIVKPVYRRNIIRISHVFSYFILTGLLLFWIIKLINGGEYGITTFMS